MSGMGHDPGAGVAKGVTDGGQRGVLDHHSGAMLAAIDLHQRTQSRGMGGDRGGGIGVVGDEQEIDALGTQRRGPVELRRHDADGVENVEKSARGEILCLREGRHRDAAGLSGGRETRDLGALGGLEMRPQRGTRACDRARHGGDVTDEAPALEHEARRRKVGERGHDAGLQVVDASRGRIGRCSLVQGKRERMGEVSPGQSTSTICA